MDDSTLLNLAMNIDSHDLNHEEKIMLKKLKEMTDNEVWVSRSHIFQAALDSWGVEAQLRMLQEECIELADAISKFFRNNRDKKQSTDKVLEEIADVKNMLEQSDIIFKSEQDNIHTFRIAKLRYLLKLLRIVNPLDSPAKTGTGNSPLLEKEVFVINKIISTDGKNVTQRLLSFQETAVLEKLLDRLTK